MNLESPFGVRESVTGLALAVAALAAVPAALAQPHAQPYYDPVRDVMVTPRMSTTVTGARPSYSASPVVSSPGAVGETRQPIYGTAPPTARQVYGPAYTPVNSASAIAAPVPGIQAVPESSAGFEQPPTAGIAPSPASSTAETVGRMPEPYYDAARDVMVTPRQSGTVRYIGAPASQRYAMAQSVSSSFDLVVRNGRLVQGPASMTVDHGAEVTLIVDSNMADTLSIDGYNLVAPITAGQPMLLKFVAEQPGRFAYRLGSGREIGILEVGPPQPARRVGMR